MQSSLITDYYKRLSRVLLTDTHIRVLELLPGPPASPVHAKLRQIDPRDKTHASYEAISYTWGTNVDEQSIEVDGESTLFVKTCGIS